MSLSNLARELILAIGDHLPIAPLSRLLRTCHSLHDLLSPALIVRITTEKLADIVLKRGILFNHLPTVHLALAHNAAWHNRDRSGCCYSAFREACERNYLHIVDAMVKHYGPKIMTNNQPPDGRYCHGDPLDSAIRSNNLELTTLLLEHGAPANHPGSRSSDKSPLDIAGRYGSDKIVEVLIKHGANMEHADGSLRYAVNGGNWGVAAVLLREGVEVWLGYSWSDSCPLGNRSSGEIQAWVGAGKAYVEECRKEDLVRRIEWIERRTRSVRRLR